MRKHLSVHLKGDNMYKVMKRLFDIFISGISLVILIPLGIIAAIGIEISDPGPVFYKADRVGKNNKHFKMYKFRSMRVDNSANEKSLRADVNRIFRWGKFMRDTKLDELPQLLNVFWGDMSIVGPRPASVDQVNITRSSKYAAIAKLKPGLSSPSALYDYIYGDTIENEDDYKKLVLKTRLDLDLYYLKVKSFRYDGIIIWYTLVCIVGRIINKVPEKILYELVKAARTIGD